MRKIKRFRNSNSEKDLWKIIANPRDEKHVKKFMNDILMPTEKSMIIQRLLIVKLPNQGWTYERVYSKTGCGMTTINKVYNILHSGSGGLLMGSDGFRNIRRS